MRRPGGLELVVCAELVRRRGTPGVQRPGRRARRLPGARARPPVGVLSVLEQEYRSYEGGERGAAAERGRSRSRRGTGAALERT